jgi:sulfonate transport system substrate-binding protein
MTISRNRALRAGLTLALTLALAAPLTATLALADPAKVIRIGSTAPGHLKFILFREKALLEQEFAKDGIKVELVTFHGGGSEATTALATGAIDVTYTGSNPALRVAASGADVRTIGLSNWVKTGGTAIVVRPDSPIRTIADLKGKKVAYLAGTVRHSSLSKALRSVGLSAKDIDSINLPFEASGPALSRGDIDAIVESDNTVQKLVEAGGGRVIADAADHPEWASPYPITVNGTFLRENPNIIKRLLKVDLETARWADANYEETVRVFTTATNSAEKTVRANYRAGQFYQDPKLTPEAIAALKAEEAFMAEAGLLKGKVDYDKWIDTTALDEVYKQAGL